MKEFRKLVTDIEKQAEKKSGNSKILAKLKKMDATKTQDFIIGFADYWSIIRLVLKLIKLLPFTGPKTDKRMDEIVGWGDELFN